MEGEKRVKRMRVVEVTARRWQPWRRPLRTNGSHSCSWAPYSNSTAHFRGPEGTQAFVIVGHDAPETLPPAGDGMGRAGVRKKRKVEEEPSGGGEEDGEVGVLEVEGYEEAGGRGGKEITRSCLRCTVRGKVEAVKTLSALGECLEAWSYLGARGV